MRMTKMIAALAALSMASAPALAAGVQPNPAAKPSIAKSVRAASPAKGASKLADGPSTLTAVFFGALVIAGIVALATSGDDDQPASA